MKLESKEGHDSIVPSCMASHILELSSVKSILKETDAYYITVCPVWRSIWDLSMFRYSSMVLTFFMVPSAL